MPAIMARLWPAMAQEAFTGGGGPIGAGVWLRRSGLC